MVPKAIRHMEIEDVERYSMGDLSEPDSAQFEEHLLICELCRDRVRESDEWVRAMVTAARKLRQQDRTDPETVFPVQLGNASDGQAPVTAPADTPLSLNPDFTGLPLSPFYEMELLDSTGKKAWRATFRAAQVPAQPAGMYRVRICSKNGVTLREFGLVLK